MEKQYMALLKVLKNKIKRTREQLKDLETIVNENAASSIQKQEYVKLKSKLETLEDVLDLAEGMTEVTEKTE